MAAIIDAPHGDAAIIDAPAIGAPPSDALACAKRGDVEALARLGAPALRAVDRYGSGALHWAAGRGHVACCRWLVERGGLDASAAAEPPVAGAAPTTRGRTPLHFAARNGRVDVVRYLAGLPGVDADARAFRGVSPLQLAVWRNELETAEALVDGHGADAAQVNDVGCALPHWLAIAPRDVAGPGGADLLPLMRWLEARLGRAAVVSARNAHGHAPLHKAAWLGHDRLCAHLVGLGATDAGPPRASDEADAAGFPRLAAFLRLRADPAEAARCRDLLGVADDAGADAIRAAFRTAARRAHPDAGGGGGVGGGGAVGAAQAARDYLLRRLDPDLRPSADDRKATRRVPLLLRALAGAAYGGGAPVDAAVATFGARCAAAASEHGDGGMPLATLPRKFKALWNVELLDAARDAGLPARRGLKRVLWSIKFAVVVRGDVVRPRCTAADVETALLDTG